MKYLYNHTIYRDIFVLEIFGESDPTDVLFVHWVIFSIFYRSQLLHLFFAVCNLSDFEEITPLMKIKPT